MERVFLIGLPMLVAVLLTVLMGLGVYFFYRATMIEPEKKDDGDEKTLRNDEKEERG